MTGEPEVPTDHRRADIQGLRAVAVAGVIANHLFAWPAGGFLGVDVFFVVSGFVITGLLLRERDRTARTSLTGFYTRRARRLLPAALIVLAATVAASEWAFPAAKADGIRLDALWSALFAANWHFAAQGSDYFQIGQAPSPLQHFWSLGVEEQFYLVWPWLFVLAAAGLGARSAHTGRARVAVMSALVGLASLAWAVVQAEADGTTAYYSSLTRAWELALGALLATLPAYAVRLGPAARAVLSWGGLAGILATFLLIGPGTTSPFPAALAAVVATLALLLAGVGAPVRRSFLLTNPASRYLGDISYGLYLWHFPLIVLVGTVAAVESVASWLVVLAATVVLAAISYHLVERPVLDAPGRQASPTSGAGEGDWQAWWQLRRRGIVTAGAALVCLVVGVGSVAVADPSAFQPTAAPALATDAGAVPEPSAPTSPTSPTSILATTTAPTATTPASPTTTPPSTSAPIPLGTSGKALQDGLRGALRTSAWPGRLNPMPDDWATTTDRSRAMEACVATKAFDPDSCTFGNRAGPEIVVYGDSLGIPLLATVVAAYGRTHKVRGLTKIACAVNGADADFGKDDWAIPCVRHRKMTVDYVKKARPAVLIMTETYAWARKLKSGARGAAAAAEWLKADQAFVDTIKDSVGHVVILSPSIPGVAFLDCHGEGGTPRRCVTGVPSWWLAVRDAESRIVGATFVDTVHWYCVDGRCPIFTRIGNTVLKGDYLHATVQYARLVAPDLRYRLAHAGVVPAR